MMWEAFQCGSGYHAAIMNRSLHIVAEWYPLPLCESQNEMGKCGRQVAFGHLSRMRDRLSWRPKFCVWMDEGESPARAASHIEAVCDLHALLYGHR
jgi:hypothetical protein